MKSLILSLTIITGALSAANAQTPESDYGAASKAKAQIAADLQKQEDARQIDLALAEAGINPKNAIKTTLNYATEYAYAETKDVACIVQVSFSERKAYCTSVAGIKPTGNPEADYMAAALDLQHKKLQIAIDLAIKNEGADPAEMTNRQQVDQYHLYTETSDRTIVCRIETGAMTASASCLNTVTKKSLK